MVKGLLFMLKGLLFKLNRLVVSKTFRSSEQFCYLRSIVYVKRSIVECQKVYCLVIGRNLVKRSIVSAQKV